MMKPTIHRNGTSPQDLLTRYQNAARAVRQAQDAITEAYPNGRDFYPQGDRAIQAAMDEHAHRCGQLGSVYRDLMELAEHVADHC